MGFIIFAIGSVKDGINYQIGESKRFESWENIREIAETIWNEIRNRRIQITQETHQAVLNRLNEYQPTAPNKPVSVRGGEADVKVPIATTNCEFGGFTIFHGGFVIVFRFNERTPSMEYAIDDIDTIYMIEFIMRSKVKDSTKEIIPQRTPKEGIKAFMVPMGKSVFFNFHNHSFDPDIKERFAASYRT
jgi:hypothetical protein